MYRLDPKLQKLILMLSSSSDGEVLAAVRAIARHLDSEGKDWHDLVDCLKQEAKPINDVSSNWCMTAKWCANQTEYLTAREQEFVESLLNWTTTPSAKQLAWLMNIKRNLERRQCNSSNAP